MFKRGPTDARREEVLKKMRLLQITKEEFKNQDFDPQYFVENISNKLVPVRTNEEDDMFDPEPFLIAFEELNTKCQDLKMKIDNQLSEVSKTCSRSEKDYKMNLKEMNKASEEVSESFKKLEARVGTISKTAVHIGQSLESVDTDRINAENARKLIDTIMKLNREDERSVYNMFNMKDPDFKTAMLLRDLSIIAQELDIPQTQKAVKAIRKLAKELEDTLILKFVEAARSEGQKKYSVMKECAQTLFSFNGGDTCTRAYLNQLEFLQPEYNELVEHTDRDETLESVPLSGVIVLEEQPQTTPSSHSDNPFDFDETDIPVIEELDLSNIGVTTIVDNSVSKGGNSDESANDPDSNKVDLDSFFREMEKNILKEHDVIVKVFEKRQVSVFEELIKEAYKLRIKSFIDKMLKDQSDVECYLKTLAYSMKKCKELEQKLLPFIVAGFNISLIIAEVLDKVRTEF
eukprot:TRINITY_DN7551_c0_g1_i1.p1 TRINITY_DN7551_c0_g1~~TRINITY_DN7551_c0_g1_i1.p1  ORF type:complete len:460 (-),score=70.47 TRINITY_DN7551_c0_g1_i1:64-1443(-)